MFNLFQSLQPQTEFVSSKLYDEKSFYHAFIHDLKQCEKEVIIESPYITNSRAQQLRPIFKYLLDRGVKIYIITRHPQEHNGNLMVQAEGEIAEFEMMGVQVLLCTGNHHRKLAILDRKILWEGSLNILSQTYSREIMRRIQIRKLAEEQIQTMIDKIRKIKPEEATRERAIKVLHMLPEVANDIIKALDQLVDGSEDKTASN